jgi:hypothetical protein
LGFSNSSQIKNNAVTIANTHNVIENPIIDAIYPTKGINADIIIIDELKNEVDVPISSGLNVVLAICNPRVHEIPSGIAAIKTARTKNITETELRAKNIEAIKAIVTAKTK